MILSLPGFDKNTNQITLNWIQCFLMKKKKYETHNKSACPVPYRKVLIPQKLWFLKIWFLISGFVLYINHQHINYINQETHMKKVDILMKPILLFL